MSSEENDMAMPVKAGSDKTESAAIIGRPRMRVAAAVVVVAATFLAYGPAIRGGWIWDDDQYVTNNPVVRSGQGLLRSWIPKRTPQYYPLVFTTYWLEYRIWGLNPMGFHLVNVAMHAVSAVLVVLILRRLKIPGAWLAGAIFALHPVHVESVAWITERKNVMSGLFYLSSMLAFLQFEDRKRWGWYAGALALFVLALFSKTVACTLPVALLLLRWLRGRPFEGWFLAGLVPFFIIGLGMGLLTASLETGHVGAQGEEWSLTFADRICLAGRALWFYPSKLTWPHPLIFFYPRWEIDARDIVQWVWPVMAVLVAGGVFLLRGRISRAPTVALAFMAVTLFPALGFFDVYPFRYSYVADHFQYLASLGWITLLSGVAAWGIGRVVGNVGLRRIVGAVGTIAICGALGTLTWQRGKVYAGVEPLWRDTIEKNPTSWMPYNNLGNYLVQQDKDSEAMRLFEKAVRLKPDFVEGHRNLGNLLLQENAVAQAVYHYEEAHKANPDDVLTLTHLAAGLVKTGRHDEAEKHYRRALEINPDFANAHSALGNLLLGLRRYSEAEPHYRKAIALRPGFAKDYYNYGVVLRVAERFDEAEKMYRQALRIRPDYAKARSSLGALLAMKGRAVDALAEFERAVKTDPNLMTAYSRWGQTLTSMGRYAEAKKVFQQGLKWDPSNLRLNQSLAWMLATCREEAIRHPANALKLAKWLCEATQNNDPRSLDVLAAAQAAAGQFEEAVVTAQMAIDVATRAKRTDLVKMVSTRKKLYESKKPYRQ